MNDKIKLWIKKNEHDMKLLGLGFAAGGTLGLMAVNKTKTNLNLVHLNTLYDENNIVREIQAVFGSGKSRMFKPVLSGVDVIIPS